MTKTQQTQRRNEVVYSGKRTENGCQIWRTDFPGAPNPPTRLKLSHSLKIWNHSPSGFEWGYGGSGPAQTSIALLLDWTGDSQIALQLHQSFKFKIVAGLEHDSWTLTGRQISDAITQIRLEQLQKEAGQ